MNADFILIAEDDTSLSDMLVRALHFYRPKATVVCAPNGAEALTVFAKQGADLVITDLSMPLMDGMSLMQSIRQHEDTTPVVLFSGFLDVPVMNDSGFSAMLPKPFSMDAFRTMLDTFLPQAA